MKSIATCSGFLNAQGHITSVGCRDLGLGVFELKKTFNT